VQIIRHLDLLRDRTRLIRSSGGTIALVPTMGALHAGHMALVNLATQQADHVIVSIFVNPKQFGPNEDLDKYPRREQADATLLAEAGVSVLWMPTVDQVYPDGFATNVSVAKLGDGLCSATRPGHFDGVATIVAKLFNQVRPDVAIFGEKDWQQLAIIRRMALDLDLGVQVIALPTQREADGLALSSRNAYLTKAERASAVAIPRSLQAAATDLAQGGLITPSLETVRLNLLDAGFSNIDYVALVDAATLDPLERLDREARLMVAARIGTTRLIDNIAVSPKK
jgi:pantoate--beta-alanine ligase